MPVTGEVKFMRSQIFGALLFTNLLVYADEFVLSLYETEQYAISEIVSAMGEKNVAKLLLDSFRLKRLGDSIRHVPPLQFLGFVLTNPKLKDCLKKISKSTFKWSSFIDGFGENMEKEFLQGKLIPQLESFSKLVGGSKEQLESYVYQEDWEEFVKCLF
jgi:hypothetical protein